MAKKGKKKAGKKKAAGSADYLWCCGGVSDSGDLRYYQQ